MTVPSTAPDVVGAPGSRGASLNTLSEDRWSNSHISTHKRRFFHYVDNAMDAKHFVYTRNNPLTSSVCYSDPGYQYVPYRTLRASINQTDWKALTTNNRSFRVKEMGFNIIKYQPLCESIKQISGITDVMTQVVDKPELLIMVDHERLTDELVETLTVGQKLNNVNDGLTDAETLSMGAAKLQRVKFNYGPELVQGVTVNNDEIGFQAINFMNDWHVEMLSPGEKYTHVWNSSNSRWYAIGNMSQATHGTIGDKKQTIKPVTHLYQSENIGVIEANQGTEINQNYLNSPEAVYVRILPLQGKTGPIIIDGLCIIEYFSVLEWLPRGTNSMLLNQGLTEKGPTSIFASVLQYNLQRNKNITNWQTAFHFAPDNRKRAASDAPEDDDGGKVVPSRDRPSKTIYD